jgi:hypothetical protein
VSNWYAHRDQLKDACSIAVSATGDHDQLDMCLETDSRLIDDWLGSHIYPRVETRFLTPRETQRLRLDRPLLAVTTLRTDAGGDASYESTWTTGMYYLNPANATGESPPQPFWEIEVRATSTSVFPEGISRGVELAGTWGWYDQRDNSSAVLSATGGALDATQTNLTVTFASALHPGQTLLVDQEQMFVSDVSSSGAGVGGVVTVERARNGTTGATHATGAAIQIYRYPIVERACLYQAQHDFRQGLADPVAGGAMFGESGRMPSAQVDLHPRVRAMLRGLRTPVVA